LSCGLLLLFFLGRVLFLGCLFNDFSAFMFAARRGRLFFFGLFPVLIVILEMLYVFLLTGFFFFFG